jgi:hypothetical protein
MDMDIGLLNGVQSRSGRGGEQRLETKTFDQ